MIDVLTGVLPVALTPAANGVVAAAAASVDLGAGLTITGHAAGARYTLPNPTDTRPGQVLIVTHAGTNSFTVNGVGLAPGQNRHAVFLWSGAAWLPMQATDQLFPVAGAIDLGNVGTGAAPTVLAGSRNIASCTVVATPNAQTGFFRITFSTPLPSGNCIPLFSVQGGTNQKVTFYPQTNAAFCDFSIVDYVNTTASIILHVAFVMADGWV